MTSGGAGGGGCRTLGKAARTEAEGVRGRAGSGGHSQDLAFHSEGVSDGSVGRPSRRTPPWTGNGVRLVGTSRRLSALLPAQLLVARPLTGMVWRGARGPGEKPELQTPARGVLTTRAAAVKAIKANLWDTATREVFLSVLNASSIPIVTL